MISSSLQNPIVLLIFLFQGIAGKIEIMANPTNISKLYFFHYIQPFQEANNPNLHNGNPAEIFNFQKEKILPEIEILKKSKL